jgi:hypothetical protein
MQQNTVKLGDAVVHEVLHAHELQRLLRDVGGEAMKNLDVITPSELEPWIVTIQGALPIYGQVYFWEVPCDMRGIRRDKEGGAQDIMNMCSAINNSFEKASAQLGRPT